LVREDYTDTSKCCIERQKEKENQVKARDKKK